MDVFVEPLALGPMQNFVYLVGPREGREVAVIDPAWDVPAILAAARAAGRELVAALLTHGHRDHVNGLPELLERHPGLSTFALGAEVDHQPALQELGDAVTRVAPGARVSVGGLEVEVLATPGHTPGAACFRAGDALFTGDTLFVGACGRCDLRGGDPERMFDSLHRVLGALPDRTTIFPGHDYGEVPSRTLGEERTLNPYLLARDRADFVELRSRPRT